MSVRYAVLILLLASAAAAQTPFEDLNAARTQCGADTECLATADFALGYAYATAAATPGQSPQDYSGRAEEAYNRVLAAYPNNPQALSNLALIRRDRGDWKGAVQLLERAADSDPAHRGAYYLDAAEVCRRVTAYDDAVAYYRKASSEGAGDGAIARLISLVAHQLEDAHEVDVRIHFATQLIDLSDERQRAKDDANATAAAEAAINGAYAAAPDLADEALARWIDLSAASNALSPELMSRVPSTSVWPSKALASFSALVAASPSNIDGCWQSVSRRQACAAAARATADRLAATNHKAAAHFYEVALKIAPIPADYGGGWLQSRPVVYLDAATQYARLLTADAALDPNGQRFRWLEDRLFNEKAIGIRKGDLPTTQRIHAVLGLIYVDRQQWTGQGPRSASYQLDHALSEAKELEAKDGTPRPLPQLSTLLAQTYPHVPGKTAADSAARYLEAAQSYLELDALTESSDALTRAETLGIPETEKPRAQALRSLAVFRTKIPTLSAADAALPSSAALEKSFIARQHFKMLSDLAETAAKKGDAAQSDQLYLRAFDAVKDQKGLGAAGDAVRLDRIRTSVQTHVTIDPSTRGRAEKGGKTWNYAASNVVWSDEMLLAAQVRATAPPPEVKVRVQGSTVVVESSADKSEAAKKAAEKMKASGVKTVTTQTEPTKDLRKKKVMEAVKVVPAPE